MPLELDRLAPASRDEYTVVGKQYGSRDTLGQGNRTRNALAEFGSLIAAHGFSAGDGVKLDELLDALVAANEAREAQKAEKKTTNKAFIDAMRAGKQARRHGRTVLTNSRRPLLEAGQTGVVNDIDAVLERTQTSGADAEALAAQLTLVRDTLASPAIATAAADRGGPEATASLDLAAQTLRTAAASRSTPHGTPVETAYLDLLDGMVVVLVRDARRAARSAAEALGRPEIANAFELTALYGSSGHGDDDEAADDTDTDVTP